MQMKFSYKSGDCIGQKYTVLKILGQGGFGTVYLVQTPNSQVFALKSIREELLSSSAARRRFIQEANFWIIGKTG